MGKDGASSEATSDRKTFKELNRELYNFANEIRAEILAVVEAFAKIELAEPDAQNVRTWSVALGVYMHDAGGSVLLLLSHGHRRAAALLNRSVFEYQIRMRYYALQPSKAREAMGQLPERFKKIMRADPTWRDERTDENIARTEQWFAVEDKIAREYFANLLKTVVGESDFKAHYDGYYGKASALVHGYETILRDVYGDFHNGRNNPKLDLKGRVWDPNDAASVLICNLLEGFKALEQVAGVKLKSPSFGKKWTALQADFGMLPDAMRR